MLVWITKDYVSILVIGLAKIAGPGLVIGPKIFGVNVIAATGFTIFMNIHNIIAYYYIDILVKNHNNLVDIMDVGLKILQRSWYNS